MKTPAWRRQRRPLTTELYWAFLLVHVDNWAFLLVDVDQTDVFLADVDELKTSVWKPKAKAKAKAFLLVNVDHPDIFLVDVDQ